MAPPQAAAAAKEKQPPPSSRPTQSSSSSSSSDSPSGAASRQAAPVEFDNLFAILKSDLQKVSLAHLLESSSTVPPEPTPPPAVQIVLSGTGGRFTPAELKLHLENPDWDEIDMAIRPRRARDSAWAVYVSRHFEATLAVQQYEINQVEYEKARALWEDYVADQHRACNAVRRIFPPSVHSWCSDKLPPLPTQAAANNATAPPPPNVRFFLTNLHRHYRAGAAFAPWHAEFETLTPPVGAFGLDAATHNRNFSVFLVDGWIRMHNAWVETVHSSGLVPQNDAQLKQYLKQWQSNLPQHVLFTDLNQRVQDEFLASQSRQVTKWESPEAFIEELASLAKLLDPLVSVSVSKVDLSIVERANKKKTVSWKDYRKSETKPAGTSIPTSSATPQSTTIPFAPAPLFDVPPGAVTFSAEPTVPEQPLSSLIEGWSTLYQRQDGNSMQEDMLQTKIGEQKNGSGEALKDKKRPQRTSSFGTTKQSSPEPLTETQPTATSQKKAMCHLWKHSGHYAEDCYVLHKELKCPVPDHWHLARNCYLNKSRVRHNSGLSDSSSDAIDDADTADAFNKADPDAPANFAAPKPRRFGVTVETMCKRPGCHNSHRADECFLAHPELICDLPGHSNHIKARCWSRQGREDKAKFNSERPERKSSQHQWSSSATDADNSASTQQQKQQQQNPGAKRRWEGETLAADKPTKKGSYRADPNHTALQVPPPSSSSSSTSSSTGASISPEPPGGANGAAVAAEGTPNTCLFCTKDRNHPAQDCPVLRKALVVATVHRAINADSVMKKQLPTPKALQDGRCEVCSAQHADGEVCKAWLAACELLQK